MLTSKIALFCPSLRGGGCERAMLNLAAGLADEDLPVDLVLASATGPLLPQVPSNVRVVDLGARRVLAALPALIRYLRRERPRAMISAMDYANIVAIWSRALSRVPTRLLVSQRNTMSVAVSEARSWRDRLIPALTRWFYPRADLVIAVSEGVADDLADEIGLKRDTIRVIYNPTVSPMLYDLAREAVSHPWLADGEAAVILAVGRLVAAKDYATLLKAFSTLRESRNCRLMILGEGTLRPGLEVLAQELGVSDSVAMEGFVTNPYAYMSRAAAYAMSSAREGLPNALIEALALGVPVVSTDCPSGPREILDNGRWGQLVPVGDAGALAEALAAALDSPRPAPNKEAVERFTRPASVKGFLGAMEEPG